MTSNQSNTFGRDEMTALLGGGDMALTLNNNNPNAPWLVSKKTNVIETTRTKARQEPDVSTLTTAETAEWLKQKDLAKKEKLQAKQLQRGTILRAHNHHREKEHVPNRQALLQEEMKNQTHPNEKLVVKKSRHRERNDSYDDDDSDLDDNRKDVRNEFDIGSSTGSDEQDEKQAFGLLPTTKKSKRFKIEPQILVRRERAEPQVITRQRRRPRRESGSSASSSDSDRHDTKKKQKADSIEDIEDDDDDDEQDARRQRLISQRRKQVQLAKPDLHQREAKALEKKVAIPKPTVEEKVPEQKHGKMSRSRKATTGSSSDSSSESKDGSSDPSSSTSEDDSSDDEIPVMAKPLFVPRHQRHTIISQDQKEEEEKERSLKKKEEDLKRKMESRMLVAEVVATAAASATHEHLDEDEGGGAINPMPDDSDPTDPIEMEMERDSWEVRELERLLNAQDILDLKKAEKEEYDRRRSMTDEERLLEDEALGLYQKPGEQRMKSNADKQSNFMQRYYHRGAFYMDDTEWTNDDVRHKAKEYEGAVTGIDKIDKRILPKIMQVKQFGHARQNTKYKGLALEDTTDKGAQYLPILSTKPKKNSR